MQAEGKIFSRGRLFHFDPKRTPQFLTWRCADSVPQDALQQLMAETEDLPGPERTKQRASRIEKFMDAGAGQCPLRPAQHGGLVQEVLLANDGALYELHAWVVMPNHVHALLTPTDGMELATIMRRVKGASSRFINEARGEKGTLWQPEYFDRFVRDADHFARIAAYIHWNPVKARLCKVQTDWPLSSAKLGKVRTGIVRETVAEYGEEFDPFVD